MTITEELKQENPWNVSNIQEFLYYNCPECDTKERDSEVFIQHALDNHEMSKSWICPLYVQSLIKLCPYLIFVQVMFPKSTF